MTDEYEARHLVQEATERQFEPMRAFLLFMAFLVGMVLFASIAGFLLVITMVAWVVNPLWAVLWVVAVTLCVPTAALGRWRSL